jgi:amino acid adenylation domain-containing protein
MRFGELRERADDLAATLMRLGVSRGDRVAVHLDRSLAMPVAILGVLQAGAAYVPIDPRGPAERTVTIARDSEVAAALTSVGAGPVLEGVSPVVIRLSGAQPTGRCEYRFESPSLDEADLAYVLYTSGSTGRPKGVMVEHRQVVAYVDAMTRRCRFEAGAHYLMLQPLVVDSSVTMLLGSLLNGGVLHVVDATDARDARWLAAYLRRHPIDGIKVAPTHLAALQRSMPTADLLPRRWLVVGGEPSASTWMRDLTRAGACRVFNHYGPTETTVGVTVHEVTPGAADIAPLATPIGLPLDGVTAHVLDAQLQPVPDGEDGQLFIGGDLVARGYLRQPALTAERFVPDAHSGRPGSRLYATGDRVRRSVKGPIEFVGRIDGQVKVRGFRVEPSEVQHAVEQHAEVDRSIVVATARDADGAVLTAYVVVRSDSVTEPELRLWLQERVPDHMVPEAIVIVPALPLTVHGKADMAALARGSPELPELFAASGSRTERILMDMWLQLLSPPRRIERGDSFFALGGHSLLAMELCDRVHEALDLELPLRAVFDHPTLTGLAAELERLNAERTDVPG